ncbi:reverse transcriptase, partial [Lasius niger]
MAAFNSMVFRMCKLPLNVSNYMKELATIKRIAEINGYKASKIDEIVAKHSRRLRLQNYTTLKSINEDNTKRRKFSFIGPASFKINDILKKHNITCVYGNDRKIENILNGVKDKTEDLKKSGIYAITCKDCTKCYIGQTRRSIEKRAKEHIRNWKNREVENSSVTKHMIEENHTFTMDV